MATIEREVTTITDLNDLERIVESGERVILNCWASWAAPCTQMNAIFSTLAKQKPNPSLTLSSENGDENNINFLISQPEQVPGLLKKYQINTVPTFILFGNGRQVDRLQGANARELSQKIEWLRKAHDDELLESAAKTVMKIAPVVLAMKGTIENPRCAFCRQVVEILQPKGILFHSVDVLADEGLRDQLRRTATWDTYPMIFANGKLIGGIDKIRQLADEGTLEVNLSGEKQTETQSVNKTQQKSTITTPVTTTAPPTVNPSTTNELSDQLKTRIESLVKQKEVMLFMKGNPDTPRCGFSRRIVKLLNDQGVQFGFFDILTDEDVRQGLKKFANWPTFPQVYAKGELVGGLDIVQDLAQNEQLLQELGVNS